MTFLTHRLRLLISTVVIVACGCALFLGGTRGMAASGATVSITVQTMDSCKQALDGAGYSLSGGSLAAPITATSTGTGKGSVALGTCPLQKGNCATFHIGCLTLDGLPVPGVYTMHVVTTPPGNVANPEGYAACQGGSACQKEEATITVAADGSVQATVTNVYPDGFVLTTPVGGSFAGTAADPIVFHLFGLAAPGSNGAAQCDADGDADDHSTGTPSSHCGYPEAQEATPCQPYPWSCAFDTGTTTTTGSGGSTTSGSSTTTTTSNSTTSTATATGGVTTTTSSTTTSTSSAGTTAGGGVTTTSTSTTTSSSAAACVSQATITWPWRATGSDSRTKHVRTVLAGPLSATLSASGATSMQISIQDASGNTMVSRSATHGSVTVSVRSLPANASVYVVESVSFANTAAKSSYTLVVTHC